MSDISELFERLGSLPTQETSLEESLKAQRAREGIKEVIIRRRLKILCYGSVFTILGIEIVGLFTMMIFQGFGFFDFALENWAFSIFSTGVLAQTFALARTIVIHLFPES